MNLEIKKRKRKRTLNLTVEFLVLLLLSPFFKANTYLNRKMSWPYEHAIALTGKFRRK